MPVTFRKETLEAIEQMRGEYPDRRSLLVPVLDLAQEEFGLLSREVLEYVGELLEIPEAAVAGVATFYHNLFTGEKGRHVIQVCRTLSCELSGAREVANRFKEILGVDFGGTTVDGLITLRAIECLASCGTAPVVLIDDDRYERFALPACEAVVKALRAGRRPEGGSGVPGGEEDLDGERERA